MEGVTRVEILDHVEAAFTAAAPTRDELLEAAIDSRARPAVLDALRRLPQGRYSDIRRLWEEMPDVPIGKVS
jgi:hypothetical protein